MQTTSLDQFPLRWRWTDEKYCVLSEQQLVQIVPLNSESAKSAWEKSLEFSPKESEFLINSKLFNSIEKIDSKNVLFTTRWLQRKMRKGNIIVSWCQNAAVITNTELFIKFWSDFCYPSSDDVTIWPEDESWVVRFGHEEVFCFGLSKNV